LLLRDHPFVKGPPVLIEQRFQPWLPVQLLTTDARTTNLSTYNTAVIAPAPNTTILVFVVNTVTATPVDIATVTGAGLTLVPQATVAFGTTASPIRRITVYKAFSGPTPGSGQLAIDFTPGSETGCEWSVFQINGPAQTVQVAGTAFSDLSGANSGTLSLPVPPAPDSVVLAAFSTVNNPATIAVSGTGTLVDAESYATPTTEHAVIDAWGQQSQAATWSASRWAGIIVELSSRGLDNPPNTQLSAHSTPLFGPDKFRKGPPILVSQTSNDFVTAVTSVTVNAPLATATATALTPTLTVQIAPALATATATALVPTLQVNLLPAAATATAAGIVPALQADVRLTPAAATATATALLPTLLVQMLPSAATATAAGLLPTLQVSVLPSAATATAQGLAPTLTVQILPAPATATADGLVPTLQIQGISDAPTRFPRIGMGRRFRVGPPVLVEQTIQLDSPAVGGVLPPVATATAQALTPTIVIGPVSVSPSLATATATALAPVLQVSIIPALATATASGLMPSLAVSLAPAIATATASGLTPSLTVALSPAVATSTASALLPTLQVSILPAVSTATATALVPTLVLSGGAVTINPTVATATASALTPSLVIGPISISPAKATATASALVPTLSAAVTPVVATATAQGLVPSLQVRLLPSVATATAQAAVPTVFIGVLIPIAEASGLAGGREGTGLARGTGGAGYAAGSDAREFAGAKDSGGKAAGRE
jgi:hypothetical protein